MAQKPAPAGPDAVAADPQHYAVEWEDGDVRVLRCRFGPRQKSAMHRHGAHVVVCLTDSVFRFTYPNGRTEERRHRAGETFVVPAVEHLPENIGDAPAEVIVIELKR